MMELHKPSKCRYLHCLGPGPEYVYHEHLGRYHSLPLTQPRKTVAVEDHKETDRTSTLEVSQNLKMFRPRVLKHLFRLKHAYQPWYPPSQTQQS